MYSRLLVGSYPLPTDASWLRDTHGITDLVSLQDDADLASKGLRPSGLVEAFAAHGITLHRLPVTDGDVEGMAARLPSIVALLARLLDGGGCVLLHCTAGYNRAPTAAIAYLHAEAGLSLADAIAHVKARRPCVPYLRSLERFVDLGR